jgi:hypothetical protein
MALVASVASAQQPPPPASPPQAPPPAKIDPRGELDKAKESCGKFQAADCGILLLTGQPFHLAIGSIAPQSGFGAGLAYVAAKNTENWRDSWNADAIVAGGGWRAGAYFKFVHSAQSGIGVHMGTGGAAASNPTELPEHPVITLTAQGISLDDVGFFGLGPSSSVTDRVFFGMRQSILGIAGVKPFSSTWHASVYGEANGRFVKTTAPAAQPDLADNRNFMQFGEGFRIRPMFDGAMIRLNYDVALRQFIATGDSTFSFQRFTLDLGHEFSLHSVTTSVAPGTKGRTTSALMGSPSQDQNGPNDCGTPASCGISRNVQGSVGVRAFLTESFVPSGHEVPFYFQPTMGGSDINGATMIGSYQDYRFRAPNLFFFRASIEHSILDWPVGAILIVDTGKVSLTHGFGTGPWRTSVSAGLTVRAGGIPALQFLYSRGGSEGAHTSFLVSTSLLGGSSRPSLF